MDSSYKFASKYINVYFLKSKKELTCLEKIKKRTQT